MKSAVFWDVMPCGLLDGYRHFGPEDEGNIFLENVGKPLPGYSNPFHSCGNFLFFQTETTSL
jgi:hypothetical protein